MLHPDFLQEGKHLFNAFFFFYISKKQLSLSVNKYFYSPHCKEKNVKVGSSHDYIHFAGAFMLSEVHLPGIGHI